MRRKAQGIGFACAIAAYIADQTSKAFAIDFFSGPDKSVEMCPFFNFVLTRNRGVNFSLLSELPWWSLTLFGLAAVALLSLWLWRARTQWGGAALGLTIGGALGNITDRIRWGAVTDLLDFHVGQYHWPAFNLADVAIVCGVGLLLLQQTTSQASRTNDRANSR